MAKKKRAKTKRSRPKPPPKCKAMLFCNSTIIEAGTGNISLIGIFQAFILRVFPGKASPFTTFLQLTDGIGRYEIKIEVHDLQNDTVVARVAGGKLAINFPNRLATLNLIIPVPPLPLEHPGVFDLVIFANDQELDRQQFGAVAAATA